jgi:hypothetical protein
VEPQGAQFHRVEHVVAYVGRLHGTGQVPQLDAERLCQRGPGEGAEQADERATLHVFIQRLGCARRKLRGHVGDQRGPGWLRPAPAVGQGLAPASVAFLKQLPEQRQQRAISVQCPFAQGDELLGRDLSARLDLRQLRAVVPDALGQVALAQAGRRPSASKLGAETGRQLTHPVDVARSAVHGAVPVSADVGDPCGASPTSKRTRCHVDRL